MESIVKQRLVQFIKFMNLTQKEFEDRCGMSNGYVANIRKSLGSDKILSIAQQFPELNRDWLLYGEGEMLKVSQSMGDVNNSLVVGANFSGNGNNITHNDSINEMIGLLKKKDEQIDRLLTIIEKMGK